MFKEKNKIKKIWHKKIKCSVKLISLKCLFFFTEEAA